MAARRPDRSVPRRRPSQGRSRATVAAILQAAARILAAQGYAGTTTNHVAARAGVSIGSLYEYFPSKDAIVAALVDDHLREGRAVLAAVAADVRAAPGSLRAVVHRYVTAMVALHAADPGLHRVLFEEAPLPRRLRTALAQLERTLAAEIAVLLRAHPEASVADPELAAELVVRTVESLTHGYVVHEGARSPARWADEVTTLVTRYLTA